LSVTCGWSVVSSTNKTDRHDITEILLKVALNTINSTNQPTKMLLHKSSQWVLLQVVSKSNRSFKVCQHKTLHCVFDIELDWIVFPLNNLPFHFTQKDILKKKCLHCMLFVLSFFHLSQVVYIYCWNTMNI
jgi:hypothetical protein